MALQTSLSSLPHRGKKAARRKAQDTVQDANVSSQPKWVEGGSSYLDGIRESLAALTDEEKEALHLSLQE